MFMRNMMIFWKSVIRMMNFEICLPVWPYMGFDHFAFCGI